MATSVSTAVGNFTRAAKLSELKGTGCVSVQVDGHIIALFAYGDNIYAVDNRCPHMGFPLSKGSIKDGILTCHWHHARFDLASGGTFDQWADDVPTFPVRVSGDDILVDVTSRADRKTHLRQRLHDGLERNISLVIAKSVIGLLNEGVDPGEPFRIGLEFGARYRQAGWGQGLTMLTCMMNLLPHLDVEDRSRALYHGLSAVARDCDGMPPRFTVQPLPDATTDIDTLKRWFRQFIEVRDSEGAERCVVSAVRAGATQAQLADMLFAAATDHRYIQVGHPLDFTNKALEALDIAGWEPERAELILTSLVAGYAGASRMEESNAWRNPVDLIAILDRAFEELPLALEQGQRNEQRDRVSLPIQVLLSDDPQAIADALLSALRDGATPVDVAGSVAYAAAMRIARFHISNEFGDWDTALHTFTFANAVHQGLRRLAAAGGPNGAPLGAPLLRGVFDAAMSVYLDRFLNVPPARLPQPNGKVNPAALNELAALLDRQQQVDVAGERVGHYLFAGSDPQALTAMLGKLLLREDRDFHTIQSVEAAVRQYGLLNGTPAAPHALIAASRYLAAHAPTMRAQGQTYQIAQRLSRGDRLFEE